MTEQHELTQYESDFLEPGYKAVCSCGWESRSVPSMEEASSLHTDHKADTADASRRQAEKGGEQ